MKLKKVEKTVSLKLIPLSKKNYYPARKKK